MFTISTLGVCKRYKEKKKYVLINFTYCYNKYKIKIYKATVCPIMTYALETKAQSSEPRQILEANDMKVLRKSWQNKVYRISQQIRESCGIQSINKWVERSEKEEHLRRMDAELKYTCRKMISSSH